MKLLKKVGIVVAVFLVIAFVKGVIEEIKKAPYGDLDEIDSEPVGV